VGGSGSPCQDPNEKNPPLEFFAKFESPSHDNRLTGVLRLFGDSSRLGILHCPLLNITFCFNKDPKVVNLYILAKDTCLFLFKKYL